MLVTSNRNKTIEYKIFILFNIHSRWTKSTTYRKWWFKCNKNKKINGKRQQTRDKCLEIIFQIFLMVVPLLLFIMLTKRQPNKCNDHKWEIIVDCYKPRAHIYVIGVLSGLAWVKSMLRRTRACFNCTDNLRLLNCWRVSYNSALSLFH